MVFMWNIAEISWYFPVFRKTLILYMKSSLVFLLATRKLVIGAKNSKNTCTGEGWEWCVLRDVERKLNKAFFAIRMSRVGGMLRRDKFIYASQ
jgi:hypothetical protein